MGIGGWLWGQKCIQGHVFDEVDLQDLELKALGLKSCTDSFQKVRDSLREKTNPSVNGNQ